ncbi:MAG: HNH endonuclease signature motif containing protein [Myxococcota bacterium]
MTIEAVWRKGQAVAGYDPNKYRKDACGAWMARAEYGQATKNGWEIDHIVPVSQGGGDQISNLQPLYWENNRYKADNFPNWSCKVRAA